MYRLLRSQASRPDRALHGYVYFRWTEAYVRLVSRVLQRPETLPRLRRLAGRLLARTHHAKVLPPGQAGRVLRVDRPIERRDLERAVPFAVARDIVLDADPRIALANCACREVARSARGQHAGSCGPLDTCLYLGDPIASFVVKHQPSKARFITREEAVGVLEAASQRGDVHTMWFKDAAGGRMYAICSCCSCCCVGLRAYQEGFRSLVGSGFVARVDERTCAACGECQDSCRFGALSPGSASRLRRARIDEASCLGCGVCISRCPQGALSLESCEEGVLPLPF
jgi:ferredoxin